MHFCVRSGLSKQIEYFPCYLHTIEILDAINVILMQGEVCYIFVHGVHQSILNVGMVQTKSMSKLMGCHKEQTVSCEKQKYGFIAVLIFAYMC